MIKVEQGGEYIGESYIYCPVCAHPDFCPSTYTWRNSMEGIFEGNSIEELTAFIQAHLSC